MKKNKYNRTACIRAGLVLVVIVLLATCAWGSEYSALGRRDPFVPLVGVGETGSRSGLEGIISIDDVHLQGITSDSDGTSNIIVNGEILREGQRVERIFVESIGDNEVVITIDDERHTLQLYE